MKYDIKTTLKVILVHYINKQTIIGESITGSVRQYRRECTVGEVERTGLRTGLSGCTEDSGVECPEMLTIQQGQNPSQVRISSFLTRS